LKIETPREVFLTFDVEGPPGREDFMDFYTLKALSQILKLLERNRLRGLFLITSSVAEAICKNRGIVESLDKHEIGFHSSSHSVKPRILEYTDLQDYEEAVKLSVFRESSRIDPFRGEAVEQGGILSLRESFPNKRIDSFRAPFDCFSPPHVKGLKQLGVRFIFSGDFSREPVSHNGLTLYPKAAFIDEPISKIVNVDYEGKAFRSPVVSSIADRGTVILALHPSRMAYEEAPDGVSQFKNPMHPIRVKANSAFNDAFNLVVFKCFLAFLSRLQKEGLVEVTPRMEVPRRRLDPNEVSIERNVKCCSDVALRLFGYQPKFLSSHYGHFFGRKTTT
jgi:hypothetical protein